MIDLSPEEFRQLGYRAVDLIAERLAGIADAPTRQPVPDALREGWMNAPLPLEGSNPAEILEAIARNVLAYPMGNGSPRFFAWVNSPPAPFAALGELLAGAHGASAAGGDHAATYIEHSVLNWMKDMLGYPEASGSILTSGGSVANLIGLAVMRHVKAEGRMRAQGMTGESAPMVVYTSAQGHSCIQKAIELLGIGSDYLRKIPVDADFRMDVDALRAQIAVDRAAGLRPVCVAASAGTVNTGAIDPLDAIADVCDAEDLWLHVDGAYGAVGILADGLRDLYAGMERADSLAVDPHKWLYIPVECGCAFVQDKQAMRDTFSLIPSYLRDDAALPWFSEFGIQQSRGFKALKLWMLIQQLGERGYRELITHDVQMARRLQDKVRARADFELVAAGPLSITCFRYAPDATVDLNALNRDLVAAVIGSGKAFLTSTELNGRVALRTCIVNFRTTEADLNLLLDVIAEAGQSVMQ